MAANLDTIKSDSDWGSEATRINKNFNSINTELITLKNTTSVYLPLFTSTEEASEKILNPRPGQLVLISPESTIPAPLYKWNGSRWADTGQTGGTAEVPLTNYYTKEEINQQKEETDSKFSELSNETKAIKANIGLDILFSSEKTINSVFDVTSESLIFEQINEAIGSGWKDEKNYKIWATNFIPVAVGKTFNVKGTEAKKNCSLIAFYDSNKTWIKNLISDGNEGVNGTVDVDFTIEEGVFYIRCQNYTNISSETSAADYQLISKPIYNLQEKIDNTIDTETKAIKANIGLDILFSSEKTINSVFDVTSESLIFEQINEAIGSGWKDEKNYKIWATDFIPVAVGKTFNVKGTEAKKNCSLIAFYDSNKKWIKNLISDGNEGVYGTVDVDFTIEEGVFYIRCQNYTNISSETSAADYQLISKPIYNLQEKIGNAIKEAKGNVLNSADWYCCGDSYSEGDFKNSPNIEDTKFIDGVYAGKNKVYSRFIALRNNMNLKLLAKCGATCGAWKEDVEAGTVEIPTYTNTFYYNQLPQILDNEDETFKGYITLWFGLNDMRHCNIGTIEDETVDTFYGALNWSAIQLITNFPLAKIGFIVSNNANSTYQQAVREVAQKWAIPYLDMEGDAQVPTISGRRTNQDISVDSRVRTLRWDNTFKVAADNSHPNEKAHEYQSTFIENWLRSL